MVAREVLQALGLHLYRPPEFGSRDCPESVSHLRTITCHDTQKQQRETRMSLRPEINTATPPGLETRLQQVLRLGAKHQTGVIFDLKGYQDDAKLKRAEEPRSPPPEPKRQKPPAPPPEPPIKYFELNEMQMLIYDNLVRAFGYGQLIYDLISFNNTNPEQDRLDMIRLWNTKPSFKAYYKPILAFLKVMEPDTQTDPNYLNCPTPEQAVDKLARIFFGAEDEIYGQSINRTKNEVYVKLGRRFNMDEDKELIEKLLQIFHNSNYTRGKQLTSNFQYLRKLAFMIVNDEYAEE
jgi:hypothetical protein